MEFIRRFTAKDRVAMYRGALKLRVKMRIVYETIHPNHPRGNKLKFNKDG